MCYCPTPTLHLNLALTGDGAFLFSLKKTHSVWFISVLNYGDTENVLINHLLLVIPMSYPCHYTNLCPHKPHKHAHTPTHTHTHTHTHARRSSLYFITTFLQNNEDMTLLLSSASSLHSLALFIASSSKFTEHSSPLSNEEWECMCLLGLVSLCVWARLCLFLYVIIYVIISVDLPSCTWKTMLLS